MKIRIAIIAACVSILALAQSGLAHAESIAASPIPGIDIAIRPHSFMKVAACADACRPACQCALPIPGLPPAAKKAESGVTGKPLTRKKRVEMQGKEKNMRTRSSTKMNQKGRP